MTTASPRPTSLLIVGLVWLAACGAGTRVGHGKFVEVPRSGERATTLDYLEAGQDRVQAFLLAHPGLASSIPELERSCVRVESRHGGDETQFSASLGSGVLLGPSGLVLTSGHVMAGMSDIGCSVVMTDGTRHHARPVASMVEDEDDWALLQIEEQTAAAEIQIQPPRKGELLLLLGFPGGNAGRDADGKVVLMHRDRSAGLAPISVIVRISKTSPPEFEPVAGVLPPQGMSGCPAFDSQGRLVTILSGVSRIVDGGGTTYLVEGSSLGSVARRLSTSTGTEDR